MRLMALRDICSLVTDGTHYTPPDLGHGVPFLTVKDIDSAGALDFDGCSKIARVEYEKAAAGNCAPLVGDVLFSKDGTVGKVSIVRAQKDFAVLSSIAILRPNNELIESDYLGHALKSPNVLDQALKKKTGSAIRRIILSDLKGVRLPVPGLSEQRRIAAILDKADALRAKRREVIAKLDLLLQSLFLDMFGDPIANPKRWRTAEIGELLLGHRSGANISPEDFSDCGFPVLHKGAIKPNGELEVDANRKAFVSAEYASARPRSVVDENYVAVTLRDLVPSGPTIGRAINVARSQSPEYLLVQGAYGLKFNPKELLSDYFVWVSNNSSFRSQVKRITVGSTQIHCRFPLYSKIRIAVPGLAEQQKFSALLSKVSALRRAHLQARDWEEVIRDSLLARAFTGQL